MAISPNIFSQDTASITGTVKDPTGAYIVGAQITIKNAERGISRSSVTNTDGEYLVAGLSAGSYDLTITCLQL
jgi:hypothetical protein